jgi:long-chain fatty acid transport protein
MHRPGAVKPLLTVFLPLLAMTGAARAASDTHYQDVIVGERAAGMGGAFTALASEATGAYYNPAGIIHPGSSIIQLGMSAYQLRRKEVEVVDLCGATISDNQNAFFSFPASFGFVKLFRAGGLEHGVGLTVVIPHYQKVTDAFAQDDASCGPVKLAVGGSQLVVDRVMQAGLSYAVRPWPRLRLGLTVGVAVRTASYMRLVSLVMDVAGSTTPLFPGLEYSNADVSLWSLYVQAGAILEPVDGLYLGLSVTSPHIRLTGSGRLDRLHAELDGAQWDKTVLQAIDDVQYNWRVPLHAAVGAAYRFGKRVTLAADVHLHAPQDGYALLEHPLLPAGVVDDNERDLVVNGNVGLEVWVLSKLALRAGGFTNLTSLPDGFESDFDRVHLYGFTLGGTYASNEQSTLSFAVQGQLGQSSHEEYVLSVDPTTGVKEENLEVHSLDFSLILSVGGSFDIR